MKIFIGKFIHMKKSHLLCGEGMGNSIRKHFSWKALPQRSPLLIQGPLSLPLCIQSVSIQYVFNEWMKEIISPHGQYPRKLPYLLSPSWNSGFFPKSVWYNVFYHTINRIKSKAFLKMSRKQTHSQCLHITMDILSFEVSYTSIFRYKRKNVLFLHIPYSILNSKYTDSNTATILCVCALFYQYIKNFSN